VRYAIPTTSTVLLVLLGACATAPERVEQLEQARAEVQALERDPLATQRATCELQAARGTLQRAESALEEGAPREEVVHLAYVAERHAEIGQARLTEARAREQVAQGEAERNRVLLEARTREAELAASKAREAQAAAQAKSQELEQARQAELAARSELESMQQQFKELEAKQTSRGMVLTLSDVLFDVDQATLKPGAALALDRLAEFLQENPQTRIIIEGHTDSTGSAEHNEGLSQRRAEAVAQALLTRGVESNRFEIMGRGEAYPVASNSTAAGRQRNRRVEIIFSDTSGQFAEGARSTVLR
jgi:outer membrane protein OmpA-like peptidoglycan-associated protein